jgi:integrase
MRAHLGYRRNATGSGTWVARRYDGSRYREETLAKADDDIDANGGDVLDFSQAQQRALGWFEEAARREMGLPASKDGRYTVRECVDDYLDWFAAHRKSYAQTRNTLEHWVLPTFGKRQVASLTTPELRKWLQKVAATPRKRKSQEPVSEAEQAERKRRRRVTANKIWATFRAALNMAFNEGRVASDLAWRRVKPFRGVDRARCRFLRRGEVLALLDACEPDFARLVRAALFTGCRYGELIHARVDSYLDGVFHIHESKSGKSRAVFLNDDGAAFFARLVRGRRGSEHLFVRDDGEPWAKSHQIRRMVDASKAAGIEPAANFHVLRHTYASHYLMNGGDLPGLSRQLGHSDTRMTMRHYAHLAEGWRRDAARQFAPSFFGDGGGDDPSAAPEIRLVRSA